MNGEKFMQRALDLATRGLGAVSPNPMVGCLIVYNNQIIGEGWHERFGGPHAEVMAVEAVEDPTLIQKSEVYVTLEPCSYHGKTPACTDLLIKLRPRKVVIASLDPNPKVGGAGLALLREAGIEVEFGVLEQEAMALNKRFYVAMNTDRPYIILKWAQTADCFIARKNYDSKWISNAMSRQLVHKWRSEEDGILVGYNTVLYDDPQLTVRDWQGRSPVRIVLDPKKELDPNCNVFNDSAQTYWLNVKEGFERGNIIARQFSPEHSLLEGMRFLYSENVGSIIIEGGAATIKQFIGNGLWDEARIFESSKLFTEGITAPELDLPLDNEQNIAGDRLSTIFNPESTRFWQKN